MTELVSQQVDRTATPVRWRTTDPGVHVASTAISIRCRIPCIHLHLSRRTSGLLRGPQRDEAGAEAGRELLGTDLATQRTTELEKHTTRTTITAIVVTGGAETVGTGAVAEPVVATTIFIKTGMVTAVTESVAIRRITIKTVETIETLSLRASTMVLSAFSTMRREMR